MIYKKFFPSISSKNTTEADPKSDISESKKTAESTSSESSFQKGISVKSEADTSKTTLSLNLDLENIDLTDSAEEKHIPLKKRLRRATEYGAYNGALSFNKLRPGILGLTMAAMAVTEMTKNASIGKSLEMKAKEQVSDAIFNLHQQFETVKHNAETSMRENIMTPSLDEAIFYSPAEKTLGSTNKFLNSINQELIVEETEKQRIRNETLEYLKDEEVSFSYIRGELEDTKSQVDGFSLSIDSAVDEVKAALLDIENFANENYESLNNEKEEYRESFDSAINRLSSLMDNISSKMEHTCDRLRDNNKGVRKKILDTAINMCDDVDEYINNEDVDDSPAILGNNLAPSEFQSWMQIKNGIITNESLDGLKSETALIEFQITQSLDQSLSQLADQEEKLVQLQEELQNTTSPVILENPESLNALIEVIDQTKTEYILNSGINHTEQQIIINNAIKEIEESMNKTLSESIIPTLENFTKKNIEELVSDYEKSGELPVKLLTWGRNLLLGITILSVAHKMLVEFETLKPLTQLTGKIPGVANTYKSIDKAGKGPAEVKAAIELGHKHPGLKCKLGRSLVSRILRNLSKTDFLTAFAVYIAVTNMHRLNDLGNDSKDLMTKNLQQVDNAITELNFNVSGILEKAYIAKQKASIEYGELNKDVLKNLKEVSETRQDVAEGLKYLDNSGLLASYIDTATGGVHWQEEKNLSSLGENINKDSMFNLTAADIYSEKYFDTFQKAVNDEIEATKIKNKDQTKSQRNWTMSMLVLSVVAGCIHEIGKDKDIYKLDEHKLAPKMRLGEFAKKKQVRNILAELALLFNRYNFKMAGGYFLKADKGYMSGNRPKKNDLEDDNTSQKSEYEDDRAQGSFCEINLSQADEIEIDLEKGKRYSEPEQHHLSHINKKQNTNFLSRLRAGSRNKKNLLENDIEKGMQR